MSLKRGFTLVELLLALSLLAVIIVGGFFCFTTASRLWRVGTDAADAIHHGDFVMEQLAMALRSAYYPDSGYVEEAYGMMLVNDGDDEEAHDSLSWVKMGSSLVGADSDVANSPHRITVYSIEPGESSDSDLEEGGIAIKAWRISALPEDFDPEDEEFVKPLLIAPGVMGLNFKVLDPEGNLKEGHAPKAVSAEDFNEESPFKWIDEDWKDDYTNRLPYAVQATIYLTPSEEDGDPIPVSRVIDLPLAPLSWQDHGAAPGGMGASSKKKDKSDKKNNSDKKEPPRRNFGQNAKGSNPKSAPPLQRR